MPKTLVSFGGGALKYNYMRIKFGLDPTGKTIHLGRTIPLLRLKKYQQEGHQIVLIIGDFTARIGDPSDKLKKRPRLEKKQIEENMKNYLHLIGKILDIRWQMKLLKCIIIS